MKPRLHSLLNFALLAACAGAGTYWAIQIFTKRNPETAVTTVPAPEPVARPNAVDMTPVARLFGTSAAPSAARLRLVGVIAEGGRGKGVALLQIEGRPAAAVRAGEPTGGGGTLLEVRADRVLVGSEAAPEEIRMPEVAPPQGIEKLR